MRILRAGALLLGLRLVEAWLQIRPSVEAKSTVLWPRAVRGGGGGLALRASSSAWAPHELANEWEYNSGSMRDWQQREIRRATADPSTTTSALLDLVDRHLCHLDAENCGAILNRFSKLCGTKEQASALCRDARFCSLLSTMNSLESGWTPKACTLCLNGLARMDLPAAPALLQRVRDRLLYTHHPRHLEPRHLSLTLNGFARQDYDPGSIFYQHILRVAQEKLDHFPIPELATLTHALGRLSPSPSLLPPALLNNIESVFLSRMAEEAGPQDLANMVFGLSKLGHTASTAFLEAFEHEALRHLDGFKPVELAMTVQALGRLGHTPSTALLDALARGVTTRLHQFGSQELVISLNGLARMGYRPPSGEVWRRWRGAIAETIPSFKPRELACLVKACARLGESPASHDLALFALERGRALIEGLHGLELACIVHSLGAMQCFPPEQLMADLLGNAAAQVEQCNAQGLANLMAGLGRLGLHPGHELSTRLHDRFRLLLPLLDSRNLADMFMGWADLGQAYPDTELLGQVLARAASLVADEAGMTPRSLERLLDGVAGLPEGLKEEDSVAAPLEQLRAAAEARLLTGMTLADAAKPIVALARTAEGAHVAGAVRRRLACELDGLSATDFAWGAWAWGQVSSPEVPEEEEQEGEEQSRSVVLDRIATRLEQELAREESSSMPAGEVVMVVVAFIRLGHAVPAESALAAALEHDLERRLEDQGEPLYQLLGLTKALTRLRVPLGPSLQSALSTRLTSELRSGGTSAHDVAAGMQCLARVGMTTPPTDLLHALDDVIHQRMAEFSPPACVLLLAGLGNLDARVLPPETIGLICDRVAEQMEIFQADGLVSVLEAMARLSYHPGRPFMASCLDRLTSRLRGGDVPVLEGLVRATRSLIRMRYHPGEVFLEALEEALLPAISEGRRLAWSCMALANFGHRSSDEMLRRLEASVRRLQDCMSLTQLSAILWGLAATEVLASSDLYMVLLAAATRRLTRSVAESDGDSDDGDEAALECSVDGMSVHQRLREAGEYLLQEGVHVEGVRRFMTLADRYWERCHGVLQPTVMTKELSSSPSAVRELQESGYECREAGGQEAHADVFWPDFVATRGEERVGIVMLHDFETSDGSARPSGGSAFRLRMLRRRSLYLDSVVGVHE